MDLNKLGKRAYECAKRRGKISDKELTPDELHAETATSLLEEVGEVNRASECYSSCHLPLYTEVTEELVDVAIVVFTELHRRGVDIKQAICEKMRYNENR